VVIRPLAASVVSAGAAVLVCLCAAMVSGVAPDEASGDRAAESRVQVAARSPERYPEPPARAVVAEPPYPTNQKGMTFGSGSGIDATNPGPDLLAAYGTNGAFGYIRATDRARALGQPPVGLVVNPQQVPPEGMHIPLYAEDGVTVIGRFTVSPGRVTAQ
jgi:hypothetical protein